MHKIAKELLGAFGFFLLLGLFIGAIILIIFIFSSGGSLTSNISSFTNEFMSLVDNMKEYEFSLSFFMETFFPIIATTAGIAMVILGSLMLIPPFSFVWLLLMLVAALLGASRGAVGEPTKFSKQDKEDLRKLFKPKLGVCLIALGSILIWIFKNQL